MRLCFSFAEGSDSSPRTARGTVRQRKAVLAAPGDHGKFVYVCMSTCVYVCASMCVGACTCVRGAGDIHMYPLMSVYASHLQRRVTLVLGLLEGL